MNTGARSLQTVVADIQNVLLKDLGKNVKATEKQTLLITPEIMQKVTAKYQEQQNRGAKNI